MKHRFSFCLLALVTAVGGCALPHNSPGPHGDRIRPVVARRTNNLPPAAMLMHPGPGVDGPGPGVFMTASPGAGAGMGITGLTSQVAFIGLDGMRVNWDVGAPGMFDSEPLIVPGRYNFGQGGIYRLKLTDISGRPGVELYPTLEVAPATPRTEAYLAHNAIPFQVTDEDLDQVLAGNFVTKVIYLPDPEFQELALAGVETLVSTRLDPGVDPVVEADRKGSILAIIRIGNKDLQVAGAGDGAMQAGFSMAGGGSMAPGGMAGCGDCGPGGAGAGGIGGAGYSGGLNGYIAGVTTPQYGMPYVGTPIGLPGPPHIPLGVPAGLQQHVMRNHTKYHIPGPVEKVAIDVKQKPGLSYPKPVDHVHITEQSYVPPLTFNQPFADKHHHVGTVGSAGHAGAECVDGECDPYEAH